MVVIKMEYVIRCSSEDDIFKAENMLAEPGCKPWLCSRSDKSGRVEVEFQLEGHRCIEFIDIGNLGCSMIEIQVGRSQFHKKTTYEPYLPTETLVSKADMKEGSSLNSVYMFNKSNFNQLNADDKWDRIKFVCLQPYRPRKQFGLSFITLRTRRFYPKLATKDTNTEDASSRRPFKFLPKNSINFPSINSILSRGTTLLNASKLRNFKQSQKRCITKRFSKVESSPSQTQKSAASTPQNEMSSKDLDEFRAAVYSFLVACNEEKPLEDTPEYYVDYFIKLFKQRLKPQEEEIFFQCFFNVLNENKLSDLLEKQRSEDESTSSSQTSSPLISYFDLTLENNSLVAKKKKMDTKKEKSSHQSPRNEEYIQPDGEKPSTSRGTTTSRPPTIYCQCPICFENIPQKKIEAHASTCGEVPDKKKTSNTSLLITEYDVEDDFMPCPLCLFAVRKSEWANHKQTCVIRKQFLKFQN